MCYQHHTAAACSFSLQQYIQLGGCIFVQATVRLVQQQHTRAMQNGARNCQVLLHAVRKIAHALCALAHQSHLLQQRIAAHARRRHAIQSGIKPQILNCSQFRIEQRVSCDLTRKRSSPAPFPFSSP